MVGMMDAMTAPAGWYPDPEGRPDERYWDGSAWTNEFRAPHAPQLPPPTPSAIAVVAPGTVSPKSRLATLLFAIFLGGLGVHSFFVGKVGVGIAQIAITVVSLGTLGWIWPLIDVILIAVGNYKDAQGRLVLNWDA